MLIPKPTKPEELYRFFIIGLPREPANIAQYISLIRRRGWNILTDSDRDNTWLEVAYYTNWNKSETWRLETYKYADIRVR